MQIDSKARINSKRMAQASPSQKFCRLSYRRLLSLPDAMPSEGPRSEDLGPYPSPTACELLRAGLCLLCSPLHAPHLTQDLVSE